MSWGWRSSASLQRVEWHASRDHPLQPGRIGGVERVHGLLPVPPAGVYGAEQHRVAQHHVAVHRRRVHVELRLDVHDPGQAHDPAADHPLGGRASDRAQPGALDHDVHVDVDVGGVAGVVARAERFDEIALGALGRQVDDVHLIPALHAQQAGQQPDRARAGDQRPAAEEERPL